jgi:hypothetical protein
MQPTLKNVKQEEVIVYENVKQGEVSLFDIMIIYIHVPVLRGHHPVYIVITHGRVIHEDSYALFRILGEDDATRGSTGLSGAGGQEVRPAREECKCQVGEHREFWLGTSDPPEVVSQSFGLL